MKTWRRVGCCLATVAAFWAFGAGLPAGYAPIEYVQGDGNAYVDLRVAFSQADCVSCDLLVTATANQMIYGSRGSSTSNNSFMFGINSSTAYLDFYNTGTGRINFSPGSYLNMRLTSYCSATNRYVRNAETGASIVSSGTTVGNAFTTPANVYLFLASGGPYNTAKFTGRIYSFTDITNGVTRLNLVPCIRRADSAVGFYDTVSRGFRENAGSGSFIPGPVVTRMVVEPIPNQTFTGTAIVPDVQVSYQGEDELVPLTKGDDYTVTCENNVGLGTARMTISGINSYEGEVPLETTFEIVAPSDTGVALDGDFSRSVIPVGSAAKIANLRVTDGEGRDLGPATYEVSYVNNARTGFATVWATGASGARAGEVLAAANFEVVVLPEGYQPLDAIVGTGTQYIDTGVKPTTTLQTDIVFTPGDSGLSESAIFGADWSTTGYFLMFYQYKFRFQSRGKTADLSAILLNERNAATCSSTGYRVNGVSASLAGTSSDKAQNIHIFDANNASKRGAFKLHAFAMRSGATTLLDLVPALRVADGRPGLLDLAHPDAAMLENAGTGEFGAESARLSVAPIENQIFTGAALEPAPAVTDRGSGAALVAGRDYEVAYSNNTTAGTGYVLVTGKGDYAGYSQTTAFYIARRVFVKTDALDGGTGASWEDAMTYTNALQFAVTSGIPVEVYMAAGTYSYTGHTLASPVTVRGATGDPKDVIINDNTAGQRAFTLKHADAVIRDLTIKGAGIHKYNGGYGGHVNMTAGTVENCIIRDGYSNAGQSGGHSLGRGGNVYMTGGRLVRCQILNGNMSNGGGSDGEYGGGVFASGAAVIDSCLVKGNNANSVSKGWGGGIYAEGAVTVANCTIVGNKVNGNSSGGGIYVNSSLVRVVNCILFNNGGTAATEFGTVNLGRFLRCASSVTNDSCATWTLMSKGDFTGFEADDFHLSLASPLLDGGSLDAAWYPPGATTLDIDGNPRVSGLAIDLGCYEADQSRVIASGAVLPCGYEGTNMTLTASAKGGTGGPYVIGQ